MTEKYTPELHSRLRELHQQASPAPWGYEVTQLPDGDYYSSLRGEDGALILDFWAVEQMSEEDSDLVLESRNALPLLLDRIEELEKENHLLSWKTDPTGGVFL